MKRLFCLILTLLLLLPAYGCQGQASDSSLTFYYPRKDYGYNAQDGKFHNSIVEPELREDIAYQAAIDILNIYLEGPLSQALVNPFPKKLSLETISIDDQTLHITVTDHLSELTGINLMIACACLCRTAMELTNTSSVQISCETALLDGKKSIVLNKEAIIFDDMVTGVTDEQE